MASNIKTFRYNLLTAGINSISEANDLMQESGKPIEARDIENFTPINRGGQTKTTGFSLLKATGANRITGLYRYTKADASTFFLYGAGTTLYKLVSGTPTSLYTSFSNGANLHFETALNQCVICDGATAPQKFDGTTVSNLGGSPPTGARQSLFYQNRLWIFGGTANPSLLYYSDPGTLDTNFSGNFVNCDVNDGQKITAIGKFFIPGNLEPVIIVGKERAIGVITGTGTTADPYTYARIKADFGIPGFRQIVQFGQDVAYLTPQGVSSYKTDNSFVNLIYAYLTEKVRDKFQALPAATLPNAIGWYDWKKTRLSWAVTESSYTYNNVIYHYDTRLQCWYKERWNTGQDCTAVFVDTDGTIYHGDSSGNIMQHDTTNSFNGGAINAFYLTPYFDLGAPQLKKRILNAKVTIRGNGAYSVGVGTSLDYGNRIGKSNTITLTAGAYMWNGGVWTSNANTYQWGGPAILTRRFIPSGYFNSIQFNFSQTGADQPVDFFELDLEVEYEAAQR